MEITKLNEIRNLITAKDLSGIGKILYSSDTLEIIKESYPNINDQINLAINEWLSKLTEGETVDICTPPFRVWYTARLLRKIDTNIFHIHYLGWDKRNDETVDLTSCRCLPAFTMTKPKKKSNLPRKKPYYYVEVIEEQEIEPSIPAQPTPLESTRLATLRLESTLSKNGGNKTEQSSRNSKPTVEDTLKKVVAPVAALSQSPEPQSVNNKKLKKSKKSLSPEEEADWICAECGDTEAPDDSDLLLCEGGCKRSFHMLCLGITSRAETEKIISGDPWVCNDCLRHRHTCAICHDEGDDTTEVMKCGFNTCGKYYHFGCLTSQAKHYTIKQRPQSQHSKVSSSSSATPTALTCSQSTDEENETNAAQPGGWGEYQLIYCPLHFCAICSDFYRIHQSTWKERLELKKCYRCPRAFHKRCIPPDCRFNDLILLCGNHKDETFPPPNYELPAVSENSCSHSNSNPNPQPTKDASPPSQSLTLTAAPIFDNSVFSGRAFGPIFSKLKLPTHFPNPLSLTDSHFRLPLQIQRDVNSLPPQFKIIFTNDYEPLLQSSIRVPFHHPDVECCCKYACDESCLNRASKIECCEMGAKSICALGTKNCGNRQFTNRQYVKVQPFREGEMGWGLRALEDVTEGTLVIEYVGEVISESQMRERMALQRQFTPNDHDFYIMELEPGLYVDGKKKGNLSRFINHSCDPNCELSRWVVRGKAKIGIFAIRDIACNEPLSYDYQFDTQETDTFKCHCGTKKCRGTMAPRQKILTKENLTNADRERLIAAGRKLVNKSVLQKEEWKRSFTGKNLPGDGVLEIKYGPPRTTFETAKEHKLFLVRNVLSSVNFLHRRELLWRRAAKIKEMEKKKRKQSSR